MEFLQFKVLEVMQIYLINSMVSNLQLANNMAGHTGTTIVAPIGLPSKAARAAFVDPWVGHKPVLLKGLGFGV